MIDDLTIIIRSSGERTVDHCKFLLEQQVSEQNIIVIEETPFSAAIKKGFEIGIERGLKWTLCIDADVLVTDDIISQLVEHAEKSDDAVFEIQGLVLDKFFPVKRPAGNHLYQTALMEKAIHCIPEEGTSLRPESDMLNKMGDRGYPWKQIDLLVGLHDFEQNYEDIYRKCFLQVHKHTSFITLIEKYWDSQKAVDNDFQVALWGVRAGKVYHGDVFVDKHFLDDEAGDIFSRMGLDEKKKLSSDNLQDSFVKDIIRNHNEKAPFIAELQELMFPSHRWVTTYCPRGHNMKFNRQEYLFWKMVFIAGNIFKRLGARIKSVAKINLKH